jgi:hypothetical protein
MADEPLYDKVKKDTGIDPDKIISEGIARESGVAYASDMETTAAADVTAEETAELEEPGRVLTKHDRCDTCRAEALGYAEKDGLDLLFCGHHLHKNEAKLREQGFEVFEVSTA